MSLPCFLYTPSLCDAREGYVPAKLPHKALKGARAHCAVSVLSLHLMPVHAHCYWVWLRLPNYYGRCLYLCRCFGINCLLCCCEHKKPIGKYKVGSRILTLLFLPVRMVTCRPRTRPPLTSMLRDARGSQSSPWRRRDVRWAAVNSALKRARELVLCWRSLSFPK